MLTEVVKPKNKTELVKRINSLKNIDVKIIEPITRSNSKDIKRDVDMFIGSNSSCSIIVVKER